MQQPPPDAARAPRPGPGALLEGRVPPLDLGWGPCQLQHHPCPKSFNMGVSILKKPSGVLAAD